MRTVDTKPARIDPNNVASSVAIRAQTWGDTAQVLNMARGYGAVLVAPHFIGESIPTQTTYVYRYRATPTLTDSVLVWIVNCYSAAPSVQFTPTYSTAVQTGIPSTFGQLPVYVQDNVASQPLIDTEYTLSITTGSGSTCFVQSIALVEMPRTDLSASEGGVDLNTLRAGDPVYDAAGASYTAIGASVGGVMTVARRVSQVHWFRVNPFVRTATSLSPWFSSSLPALNRRGLVGQLTRTVSIRIYAEALVQPGEVRVMDGLSGTFVNIPVPVGAYAWTTLAQQAIDCESGGTVNGLQGGLFDTLGISARTTVAGGTINVRGVSIWESENDVP